MIAERGSAVRTLPARAAASANATVNGPRATFRRAAWSGGRGGPLKTGHRPVRRHPARVGAG